MNDPFSRGETQRVWRQDQGALAAGVCAGLAEDLDLPLPVIRITALLFLVLPTGLAYLALTLLLRRRPQRRTGLAGLGSGAGSGLRQEPGRTRPAADRPMPTGESWALLRHRFETLEPRLGRIEEFVTAPDFELHRGFRRMGE